MPIRKKRKTVTGGDGKFKASWKLPLHITTGTKGEKFVHKGCAVVILVYPMVVLTM